MKKTVRALLLAVLVVCTVCVLTVVASAAEVVESGFVMNYSTWVADGSEENVANDGTANDVTWTFTDDGVLTLTSTNSTMAEMNPHASWRDKVNYKAYIPWYNYLNDIKSVVVDEKITAIKGGNFFGYLTNCESITFKASGVNLAGGSMIFNNLANLKSLTFEGADYTGFEGNIIDLRTVTGTSEQAFENSCKNMDVTVLMPYVSANPIRHLKVFCETTNVTFYVLEGSSAASSVATIKNNADNYDTYTQTANTKPYVKNVTVKNYDTSTMSTITGGVEGQYQYNFNLATGKLVILNKYTSGWKQFDTQGPEWTAFKNAWGQYVKTAVVDKFDKISYGSNGAAGCSPLFSGMANLETVAFQTTQRMQNGKADTIGWFQGCTALKSVTFGGELVDGVADFSGMTFHKEDSTSVYLSNIFNGCANIKEVVFPENEYIISVKSTTFAGCTSLEKVTLLSNIKEIAADAFASCPEVVLVVEDGSYAHTWAQENDVAFELYEKEEEANVITGKFSKNNDLTYSFDKETKVLTIAGTGEVLEMDYTLDWEGVVRKDTNGDGITEVVAHLPWLAKNFAADVKEVVIEANIVKVGEYMLSRLTNCEKITIPATLTNLGQGAFAYADTLNVVVVAGKEAQEGVFDFTNIKQFGAYTFDDALDNVTPTINFGTELTYFGTAKMAQKCQGLTINLAGNEVVAAAFLLDYATGKLVDDANICQKMTVNYNKDFNPFVWEGYAVRLTDYNGLRSVFSVNDNSLALYAAANGLTVKEYGTIVGTLENIDAYGYELTEGKTANEKIIKTPVYADGEFVGKLLAEPENGNNGFAVTLVRISEANYETKFASLVYFVVCDGEGKETVKYFCIENNDIKTVATKMYENGMFDEETGPVAMEIVNYGKEALETPVAYAEKCYLGF